MFSSSKIAIFCQNDAKNGIAPQKSYHSGCPPSCWFIYYARESKAAALCWLFSTYFRAQKGFHSYYDRTTTKRSAELFVVSCQVEGHPQQRDPPVWLNDAMLAYASLHHVDLSITSPLPPSLPPYMYGRYHQNNALLCISLMHSQIRTVIGGDKFKFGRGK